MPIPPGGWVSPIDPVVTNPDILRGTALDLDVAAVTGTNKGSGAIGLLGCIEPLGKTVVGVFGVSGTTGVIGFGGAVGVAGNTDSGAGTGVHGHTSTGIGVLGTSDGSGPAGRFSGRVEVFGDIRADDVVLTGGDCAEHFDVAAPGLEAASPGTVMVIDDDGSLRPGARAYDKRAAGVVSGAGDYKPGILLDTRQSREGRVPIALVGKVFCKVDARYGPIEVGDLLTTSETPGHAMKADNPLRAFGAVIGKALRPLAEGQGLIPILIALQ